VARQIIQSLIDDIDGGTAHETVRFAFDGIDYEIDLSNKNAAAFRKAANKYVDAGRRQSRSLTRRAGTRTSGRGPAVVDREQNNAIREWARRNGKSVSDRGRIPAAIVEEYHSSGR